MERYQATKMIRGCTSKLRRIKRRSCEDLADFSERFDDLTRRHEREVARYPDRISQLEEQELCNLYTRPQRSSLMKKFIRTPARPRTLKEDRRAVRQYEEDDSDDEPETEPSDPSDDDSGDSDDDVDSSDSESSDSDDESPRRRSTKTKKKLPRSKNRSKEIKEVKDHLQGKRS